MDFQFDCTLRKAIKIGSMLEDRTGESPLDIVERSITAARLIAELRTCFAAACGPALVLRMNNRRELISKAVQSFCAGQADSATSHHEPDDKTVTSNRSETGREENASIATTGRT